MCHRIFFRSSTLEEVCHSHAALLALVPKCDGSFMYGCSKQHFFMDLATDIGSVYKKYR